MAKKTKLKENPLMIEEANVKNKNIKSFGSDDDGNEVKKFVIIILVIAVCIGVVYFLTENISPKKVDNSDKTVTAGSINYDKTSVGRILNQPYDEYYVLLYDFDNHDAILYSGLLSSYMQKKNEDNFIKIFYCDLNNKLNNTYYNVGGDNKSNPKATKVEDFDFGDLTLLKISKGKIVEYLEDYEIIKEKLK